MKFKQYLMLIADADGFIPTQRLRQVIRKNERPTAREEAIAAEVIQQANPREPVTGSFPWGPEQQIVLQQLWINTGSTINTPAAQWRDIPIEDADKLFTTTDDGLPVPNAVKKPEVLPMDLEQRLREILD